MKWPITLALTALAGLQLRPALAQLNPDTTLGGDSSQITPGTSPDGLPIDIVEGGALRDSALFHSFLEFNVGNDQQVYFANPDGVTTIFSRVTGNDPSDINGTLGVIGPADLFFLNPNGILFGPNAQLNLEGSFVASTAESVLFEDDAVFSTAADQTEVPLLTISTPVGLQFGRSPEAITNQASLNVVTSDTLALVGGDLDIIGGGLVSFGAIELTSAGPESLVAVTPDKRGYQFSSSENSSFQDINVANAQIISGSDRGGRLRLQGNDIELRDSLVSEATLGSEIGKGIYVQANTLRLLGNSVLSSIATNDSGSISGDVTIQVSEQVEITGNGEISANNSFISTGSNSGSGNISITTPRLLMSQTGLIFVGPSVNEASGNIFIEAADVQLSDPFTQIRAINSFEEDGPSPLGQGGEVSITTARLLIENGASISAETIGLADAGSVTVNASDWIRIIGVVDQVPFPDGSTRPVISAISVLADGNAIGNAGNITINTPNLRLAEGGRILSLSAGAGNGGIINLNVENLIEVKGFTPVSTSIGTIDSAISASGFGDGDAGDIIIESGGIRIQNAGTVETASIGNGDSGDIFITADWIHLLGEDPIDDPLENKITGISAQTRADGEGGDVILHVDNLLITEEAFISSTTVGTGNAGDITIMATESVRLVGQADNTDDFQTNIGTSADGDAFMVELVGSAGDIMVTTPKFFLSDGAFVTVAGFGGPTGILDIDANLIRLNNDAILSARVGGDGLDGGEIFLTATDALILSEDSRISAEALDSANGGNVDIQAGFVIGLPPTDPNGSDIIARAFEGDGGIITIRTDGIYGLDERPAIDGNRTNDIDALKGDNELGSLLYKR